MLLVPTSIIGSLLLINGARFIRHDLSLVVEELLEEQEEQRKRAVDGVSTPVLQIVNTDFSYGPVQVLFDVNFEIHRGECVALLGTNGAGKSTILRCISGLEVPERGVLRLNGRNITFVAPEQRVKHGIVQLPGGKGVFPSLTVMQNLAVSARLRGGSSAEIEAAHRRRCSSCSPSSPNAPNSRRAASPAVNSRCSRSHGCSCRNPRSS